MGLFFREPRFTVCRTCGVHFHPHSDSYEEKDLCRTHRQPYIDQQLLLHKVSAWARLNPEKIQVLLREEEEQQAKDRAAYFAQHQAAGMNTYANAQQPLTDEQMVEVYSKLYGAGTERENLIEMGRAVERAHGIGGEE